MPWLLHASDPHLGNVSAGQELDDEKEIFEGQPDLETTQAVFRRTLRALGRFVDENGKPDVAVFSGDIAIRADQSGFDEFAELLEGECSEMLPRDRSKIVVVPGNHDVVWEEDPGSPKRYGRFLGATRDLKCSTPLLDGIDFDLETGVLLDEAGLHSHVVETDDLLVVPLNSSNYCGVMTTRPGQMSLDDWETALEPVGASKGDLLEELERSRRQDIARVSRPQIDALGRFFDKNGIPRDRSAGDGRTRVAVLHHQLLPVSTREERKAFESLVNLGLVREWLRDYDFDLVLHGHKHESGTYWDLLNPANDIRGTTRRVLVVSSPGHFNVNVPVMRAIKIEGSANARNARITTFMGAGPQRRYAQQDSGGAVPLWSNDLRVEDETLITGADAHTCYSRLRAAYAIRGGAEMRNVVCRVDDPVGARTLPPDYPDVGFENRQEWFDSLVSWWQLDRSELVARGLLGFNHGERIRRRWGDQVERAARVLDQRGESSRALIQLVAPQETGRYADDERDLHRGSFPAFVLAEFSVAERDGRRFLDCFGYFRKQEMQFWWPVNLAELALLQEAVRSKLQSTSDRGRIVTFSAIALWKEELPRVAVPLVDLFVEEPGRLLEMAIAVAFPSTGSPEAVDDWRRVLDDLGGRTNPPTVAAGIEILYANLSSLADVSTSKDSAAVIDALEELRDEYAAHADRDVLPRAAVRVVARSIDKLAEAVTRVLPEAAS